MNYYCKQCDNSSWSEPFEDGLCDDCWDEESAAKDRVGFNTAGQDCIYAHHHPENKPLDCAWHD
jgi:hypothetical protein